MTCKVKGVLQSNPSSRLPTSVSAAFDSRVKPSLLTMQLTDNRLIGTADHIRDQAAGKRI